MKLYDLIVNSATRGLELQYKNGSFPKGKNGPWKDNDTYMRTTAHWAQLLYKAYLITTEDKYLRGALRACNYLIDDENRPNNFTFLCRISDTKDNCNGLIGQAWTLEPLIQIGIKEKKDEYINISKNLLERIPFNKEQYLWETIDVDDTNRGCHRTINQQLWISVMSLILGDYLKDDTLINNSTNFFLGLSRNIEWLEYEGLIKHTTNKRDNFLKNIIKKAVLKEKVKASTKEMQVLSNGYLSFILHGFALAYDYCSEYSFWQDASLYNIIKQAYNFLDNRFPFGYLESDKGFRWAYNPVGIEMAYATQVFDKYISIKDTSEKTEKWLSLQISGYYDFNNNLMNRNTIDQNILSSRLYESINLKNIEIKPEYWSAKLENNYE
ncbi:hypothetical protein HZF24_10225 [Sedimentibacter hydroxybenzoicus DSM 7310]|uniref:Uncharacterized protein n=1 Tax=Sedimentibacter hydroxybenzoicus DSM 7310 TaxID=1123245 RepID=A0A974GWQ8_SEDHY|nr:hypothetical protein [Sedimentibacter hydroxybenzoicus]NYB74511.1 hypothetical protein [Sedimentibacter hydroxybenzoicus DSM 7310]